LFTRSVVEVWDSDKLGADDYLGNVLVPVAAQREYKIRGWFSLSRGSGIGSLLAQIHTTTDKKAAQVKSTGASAKSTWCVP
jgi:hypothetical protein